jgi:hypothetical protein
VTAAEKQKKRRRGDGFAPDSRRVSTISDFFHLQSSEHLYTDFFSSSGHEEIAHHTTCWSVFCTEPQLSIFVAQNTNISRNCCAKYK